MVAVCRIPGTSASALLSARFGTTGSPRCSPLFTAVLVHGWYIPSLRDAVTVCGRCRRVGSSRTRPIVPTSYRSSPARTRDHRATRFDCALWRTQPRSEGLPHRKTNNRDPAGTTSPVIRTRRLAPFGDHSPKERRSATHEFAIVTGTGRVDRAPATTENDSIVNHSLPGWSVHRVVR